MKNYFYDFNPSNPYKKMQMNKLHLASVRILQTKKKHLLFTFVVVIKQNASCYQC